VGLTCMADRWAWSPLVVKAMSIIGSGERFMTLSMPCMILGMVHEQFSLHLLGGINNRLLGVGSLTLVFHSLL
jgi:hypothetical protein